MQKFCVFILEKLQTTNNRHPLTDATGSRRYICLSIPSGQLIDNNGDINYEQLYAYYQVIPLKVA